MAYGWDTDIVDIKTTFLHSNLEEEIFMKAPEGLVKDLDTVFNDDVCLVLVQ